MKKKKSNINKALCGFLLRFGFFRFRSPLLTKSMFLSLFPGTQMFQFSGFPSHNYGFIMEYTDVNLYEFPHSDIYGSLVACTSPQLFAAYHVLLRLLAPRHSPYALFYLIASYFIFFRSSLLDFFVYRSCINIHSLSPHHPPRIYEKIFCKCFYFRKLVILCLLSLALNGFCLFSFAFGEITVFHTSTTFQKNTFLLLSFSLDFVCFSFYRLALSL